MIWILIIWSIDPTYYNPAGVATAEFTTKGACENALLKFKEAYKLNDGFCVPK